MLDAALGGERSPLTACTANITIHRLKPSQTSVLHRIALLERKTFSKAVAFTPEDIVREASKKNGLILYAVHSPTAELVLGYVTCTSAKLALHISKIAVESHFRRQGIASALLQEALRVSRRTFVTLHVDPRNASATALYSSLGFQLNGVLPDYYSPGCPAHKLAKDLSFSA